MKDWFIITVAFLVGAALSVLVLVMIAHAINVRRGKRSRTGGKTGKQINKRKIEFSKLILALVLFTYFVGVFIGVKVALIDMTQLGVLLAFIGTPTAAAIGFYCWKAKAENTIKIKKEYPKETADLSFGANDTNETWEG